MDPLLEYLFNPYPGGESWTQAVRARWRVSSRPADPGRMSRGHHRPRRDPLGVGSLHLGTGYGGVLMAEGWSILL